MKKYPEIDACKNYFLETYKNLKLYRNPIRDALLVTKLISNPLRVKQFDMLTFSGTGEL